MYAEENQVSIAKMHIGLKTKLYYFWQAITCSN